MADRQRRHQAASHRDNVIGWDQLNHPAGPPSPPVCQDKAAFNGVAA